MMRRLPAKKKKPVAPSAKTSGDCELWMKSIFGASDMFATFLSPQGTVEVYHATGFCDPWLIVPACAGDKASSPFQERR